MNCPSFLRETLASTQVSHLKIPSKHFSSSNKGHRSLFFVRIHFFDLSLNFFYSFRELFVLVGAFPGHVSFVAAVEAASFRLEHGYTRGSQVRDPYPYPWDTHYPNTNAGLDTGTDPQMRVAV